MKKLIKLTITIAIIAIFVFSKNPIIEKARTFVYEKGMGFYELGINKMNESDNENIQKAGSIIE